MRLTDKRRKRRRLLWAIAPIAVLCALCFSETFVHKVLYQSRDHHYRKMGKKLLARGVVGYWDFDEPRVAERIWRDPVITEGTRLVPGRCGGARAFIPEENGYISTRLGLARLGTNFTISCWLRLPGLAHAQRILRYMRVEGGRLVFEAPATGDLLTAEPPAGRFAHIAAVVDAAGGEARLYVDGKMSAATEIAGARVRHETVWIGQVPGANRPDFVLDDLAMWNRCLSESEISRLANTKKGLLREMVRSARLKFHVLNVLSGAASSVVTFGDMFNPLYHESTALSANIPRWSLLLSRADEKAFAAFESRRVEHGINGYCTSDRRTVDVALNGSPMRGRMEMLCPGTGGEAEGRAFSLSVRRPGAGELHEKFMFEPPHSQSLVPDMLVAKLAGEVGSRAGSPELCCVTWNGGFAGVFLLRRVGEGPDYYSPSGQRDWRKHLRALPFTPDEVLSEFDRIAGDILPVVLADRRGVLNSVEWRHLIREQRADVAVALEEGRSSGERGLVEMVKGYLSPYELKGENPVPEYIVGDLDLSRRSVRGVKIDYRSLTPEILSDDGRVVRPASASVDARLAVIFSREGHSVSNVMEFTVIGTKPGLPLVKLDVRREMGSDFRVPCSLQLVEKAGAGKGELLYGRVRIRGNTSLAKAKKKYFSVKLDRPAKLLGIRETGYIMLTSGWRDPTMMHDKLSYDLFRSFSSPGKPRFATTSEMVELVVDGRYRGVYIMSDRVDAELLGMTSPPHGRGHDVLYKSGQGYSRVKPYVQKWPDRMDGEYWAPLREFMALVHDSTPDEFAARAEKMLDIDNVIDFELLVNFNNNAEGGRNWSWIARGGVGGDRFYFLPWDFDMTFRRGRWNANALQRRLRSDLPGYRGRLESRYRELRNGVLSEKALTDRVARMEDAIADAMRRNRKCWDLPERKEFHMKVDEMREIIRERMALMDRMLSFAGE